MARHTSLRASDADRDAVAERLRHAAVEGRLEPDELEERLHMALRARTYGDLDGLLGDLPAKPVRWERRRTGVAPVAAVAPAAGVALVVAMRLVAVLAVLSVVVVVVAVMTMAWWLIAALVWLSLRAGRGCRARRLGGRAAWQRPPHVRRV